MRKVHLHGALGERFGSVYELDIRTAGEAVRALSCNFPGFTEAIRSGEWHIVRGEDPDRGISLDADQAARFNLGGADVHFIPVIAGSKNDGMLKAVLGVALVGGAFALSGGALATPIMASGLLSSVTYGNIAMLGLGLALSGASSMLAPEQSSKEKNDQSYAINGPTNLYAQGSPVPLVYGEVFTGGVTISGGIDVEKIAVS